MLRYTTIVVATCLVACEGAVRVPRGSVDERPACRWDPSRARARADAWARSMSEAPGIDRVIVDPPRYVAWYDDEAGLPPTERIPTAYREYDRAFAHITIGGRSPCSGVHVGHGLVLTAGHCIPGVGDRTTNEACPEGMVVRWDYVYRRSGAPSDSGVGSERSSCVRVEVAELSRELDFAIVRVSPAPRDKVPVNLTARPTFASAVTLVGHPEDRPREWSHSCEIHPTTRVPYLPFHPSFRGWRRTDVASALWENVPTRFLHTCDTATGSSGSPVFSANPVEVVGIHAGGHPHFPWNYGTFVFDTPLADLIDEADLVEPPL